MVRVNMEISVEKRGREPLVGGLCGVNSRKQVRIVHSLVRCQIMARDTACKIGD